MTRPRQVASAGAGEIVFDLECAAEAPLAWVLGTLAAQNPGLRAALLQGDADWLAWLDGRRAEWWEEIVASGSLLLMRSLATVQIPG